MDLEMPNMNGRQALEKLAVIAPELARRTILVTGGSSTREMQEWLSELPPDCVRMKPVNVASLMVSLDAILAGP
jgi:DNA-binding NarL/FixJ family response regulator